MRKGLGIVPVLFLLAVIGAPSAHADSYTPNFTCTGTCTFTPTAPNVSFPWPTTINVTYGSYSFLLTLSGDMHPGDTYDWRAFPGIVYGDESFIILDLTCSGTCANYVSDPLTGPSTDDSGALTFAAVATPEPSSLALMLIGIGLLGFVTVLRKRIGQGLPQAS